MIEIPHYLRGAQSLLAEMPYLRVAVQLALDEDYFEGAVEAVFAVRPELTRDEAVDLIQLIELTKGVRKLKLRFKLTFKSGPQTVAVIEGLEKDSDHFLVEDVHEKIIETEQYLERLTGLRVHIEQNL